MYVILESVDKAISSMKDDFLIKSFLVKHKEEGARRLGSARIL